MINGISATDLGAYIEHLKQTNETVSASDLSYSLEEYLDTADAESVIEIDDATLESADKDTIEKNADKLALFGVSDEKIQELIDNTDKSENTENLGTNNKNSENKSELINLQEIINKNAEFKQKDKNIISKNQKNMDKNNQMRAPMQEKINVAMEKNEALQNTYNKLKNEVKAEQAKKEIVQQQEQTDLAHDMFGKIDKNDMEKTEKGQNIEKTNQEMMTQKSSSNDYQENTKLNFNTSNNNLNATINKFESSNGHTLAGDNLFNVGKEVITSGEEINDSSILLIQEGQAMMLSEYTAVKGKEVYDRAINLANDSFETITSGQENVTDSTKYYTQSFKAINSANMFMNKTNKSVNNINSNNDTLTNKIAELQSKKAV